MKKILSLILVIALVAGIAVTGTMAYLTDRDNETNVFTVGDVNIELSEEYAQGSQLLPGVTITKKPTIENVGKNDAWVWLTYAVPTALKDVVTVAAKWTAKGVNPFTVDIDEVEYTVFPLLYDTALEAGEKTTTAAFDSVTLSAKVDADPDGKWYTVDNGTPVSLGWNNSNGAPVIYVNAYAIQTEISNVKKVEEAYAAYVGQWGANLSGVYDPAPTVTEVETAEELKNALVNGGLAVLNEDVDLDILTVTKETEINLNGNELKVSKLKAMNGGELKISNGELVCGKTDYPALAVDDGGILIMDNVTIICNEPCNVMTSGTLEAAEYVALQIFDGKAILNNCNISANVDKVRYMNAVHGIALHGGELVMNGGSITITSAGSTHTNYQAAIAAYADGEKTVTLNNVEIDYGTDGYLIEAGKGNIIVNTTDKNVTAEHVRTAGGTCTINYID